MNQIGVPQGVVSLNNWSNFFRGETAAPPAANYYNGDLINGYDDAVAFAQAVQAYAASHGGSGAQSWVPLAERPGVIPGTPFLPSEIQDVIQKNGSAYAMLRFGSPEPIFGNVRLDGNIGVRYVRNDVTSVGAIGAPSQSQLGITQPFLSVTNPITGVVTPGLCDPRTPPPNAPSGTPTTPGGVCALGAVAYAQLQQFATGLTPANSAINKYNYWLPSINLKFGLSRDLVFRLAASRDFAYPSLADIRNYQTFGLDTNGHILVTTGNPLLKPITSDNFDASLEWYFAGSRVGLVTIDVFAKNIHNYVYNATAPGTLVSNGITEGEFIRGPNNFSGTGHVKGIELSYSQTYDFLPGFLSGFGLSANYTYLSSKGIPNSFLNGGAPVHDAPIGTAGNLPLAQLSRHNFNIAPFYEKGPLSIRVAYSWRSKFLLTESDVIFPYDPIWNAATGSLDASIFLTLNRFIKVGVQATNLTNEVTKTLQQFDLAGDLAPRSYFMNDRRYSFIVRGSFGGRTAPPPPPPVLAPPPPAPPPVATQTCPDGSVIEATATCPAPPPPPPPPPAPAPERG
jgi:TonB-dependent receptor